MHLFSTQVRKWWAFSIQVRKANHFLTCIGLFAGRRKCLGKISWVEPWNQSVNITLSLTLLLPQEHNEERRGEDGKWDIEIMKKLATFLFPWLICRILEPWHTREERNLKLDERLDVVFDWFLIFESDTVLLLSRYGQKKIYKIGLSGQRKKNLVGCGGR